MAFATISRSPNSCVRSFRYGVSPHPAHAPENSNSGRRICEPFTVSGSSRSGGGSGIDRKKSNASRSGSRCGSAGSMFSALCLTSCLLRAGQTSTQTPHPVQSSGATWIDSSRSPGARASRTPCDAEPLGRAVQRRAVRTPSCGPRRAGTRSRTCRSRCRSTGPRSGSPRRCARFSHRAVPVGNVPSTGQRADRAAGRRPRRASARSRAGRSPEPRAAPAGRRRVVAVAVRRHADLVRARRAPRPRPPGSAAPRSRPACRRSSSIDARIAAIASSRGSTPESAKKHGCMTVLMRPPIPASRATAFASITHSVEPLVQDLLAAPRAGGGPTPRRARTGCSAGTSRRAPPAFSTSMRSRSPN